MEKPVIGHLDCPHCGAPKMMRFIRDRNEKPFGHCDDCNGQLRVGGNTYRERKFAAMHPWAAGAETAKISVTVTEQKPEEKAPEASAKIPVTATAHEKEHHGPVKKRSAFEDAISILGGAKK